MRRDDGFIVWALVAVLTGLFLWLLYRSSPLGWLEGFQQTVQVTQAMRDTYQQILRDQGTDPTKTRIQTVMEPAETDSLKVAFPRHMAFAALAYTAGDAAAARKLLLSSYDTVETQILPAMNPSPADIAAFNADKLKFTCDQLVALKTELTTKLAPLKTGLTDLNSSIDVATKMKDENMGFQKQFEVACTGTLTDGCKALASQDSLLYPLVGQYDSVTIEQSRQQVKIQNSINTINDVIDVLRCPIGGVTFDPDKDFAYLNVEGLRLKLEELSPYYLSPASIQYIAGKLFDGEQIKFADSSRELTTQLGSVMGEVVVGNGYRLNSKGQVIV